MGVGRGRDGAWAESTVDPIAKKFRKKVETHKPDTLGVSLLTDHELNLISRLTGKEIEHV